MTPHIEAKPGDYAEDILLPGDPARAEWIAETFLSDVRVVNRVRGAIGLTGTYQGRRVERLDVLCQVLQGHGRRSAAGAGYAAPNLQAALPVRR